MLSTQKPKPIPATPADVDDPPTTAHEATVDTPIASDLYEYDVEGPTVHEGVPDPPKCIKARFERNEWTWRWLSKPHVNKRGTRMYTTYSPTDDERTAIERGDRPAGVSVSVDNRVCWGEDAFLGYIPKRFFVERQRELDRRNARLLKSSRDAEAFTEFAKKAGFRSPSVQAGPDDRPTFGLGRR